jgi:hypothetical protein
MPLPTLNAPHKDHLLTEMEVIFIERYVTHWNGARAAQEAGYCPNNPQNARRAAEEILRKADIRAAIDYQMKLIAMEANEALARLASIARGDIADLLTQNLETGLWEPDIAKAKANDKSHLIKSYSISRQGTVSIEMYSAMEALDKIAKHLNLFKDSETTLNVSLTAWAQFVKDAKDASDAAKPAQITATATATSSSGQE